LRHPSERAGGCSGCPPRIDSQDGHHVDLIQERRQPLQRVPFGQAAYHPISRTLAVTQRAQVLKHLMDMDRRLNVYGDDVGPGSSVGFELVQGLLDHEVRP
jgi:hypothetical protein